MTLEEILRRMVDDGKSCRALLANAAHDIGEAVNSDQYDRIDDIVRAATSKLESAITGIDEDGGADGVTPVESGGTDGSPGVSDAG